VNSLPMRRRSAEAGAKLKAGRAYRHFTFLFNEVASMQVCKYSWFFLPGLGYSLPSLRWSILNWFSKNVMNSVQFKKLFSSDWFHSLESVLNFRSLLCWIFIELTGSGHNPFDRIVQSKGWSILCVCTDLISVTSVCVDCVVQLFNSSGSWHLA